MDATVSWQLIWLWTICFVRDAKRDSRRTRKLSIRMVNSGIRNALCKWYGSTESMFDWIFNIFFLSSCAQCFRAFQDGIFYEFEGRKYCERDFHVLFAPCCNKCGEFVIGRVIKAMAANWHPQCFCCEMCSKELADCGFIRNQNRALCHDCNARVKAVGLGKYVCNKCQWVTKWPQNCCSNWAKGY